MGCVFACRPPVLIAASQELINSRLKQPAAGRQKLLQRRLAGLLLPQSLGSVAARQVLHAGWGRQTGQ